MRLYEFDTLGEAREYLDPTAYGSWIDTNNNEIITVGRFQHNAYLLDRYGITRSSDDKDEIYYHRAYDEGLVKIEHEDPHLNIGIRGKLVDIKKAWKFIRPTAMKASTVYMDLEPSGFYMINLPQDRAKLMKIMSS